MILGQAQVCIKTNHSNKTPAHIAGRKISCGAAKEVIHTDDETNFSPM